MLGGHFSGHKNREKTIESHKRDIRNKAKKNRKSYIGYKTDTELKLPKFTKEELKKFKEDLKRKRKISLITNIVIILAIIILTYYLFFIYNKF